MLGHPPMPPPPPRAPPAPPAPAPRLAPALTPEPRQPLVAAAAPLPQPAALRAEYELRVVLQPDRARSCGFGNRLNRRTIDPCVVVQLGRRRLGAHAPILNYSDLGDVTGFVLSVSLVSVDMAHDLGMIVNPQDTSYLSATAPSTSATPPALHGLRRSLSASQHSSSPNPRVPSIGTAGVDDQSKSTAQVAMAAAAQIEDHFESVDFSTDQKGCVVEKYPGGSHLLHTVFGSTNSACLRLTDLDGIQGAYFLFPELCLRIEGQFRLKFSLFDIAGCLMGRTQSTVIATAFSEPFRSYNPRAFPGMQKSPPLIKHFFRQGAPVLVRSKAPAAKSRQKRRASALASDDDGDAD
ncbi:hypothetical protein HK105_209087 [Polyrhizophydium stewartii]|uniref:Velvet domain-containing protein n=1 Tax=Polyrhizophydium stewartii TaxID=2732419 RepID=A0ABR4MVZ7_9FUNG